MKNKYLLIFFSEIFRNYTKQLLKISTIFEKIEVVLIKNVKFSTVLAFLLFRACFHRKERKKCCKMSHWTLKNSPIQPRTRHLKFPKIGKFRFYTDGPACGLGAAMTKEILGHSSRFFWNFRPQQPLFKDFF